MCSFLWFLHFVVAKGTQKHRNTNRKNGDLMNLLRKERTPQKAYARVELKSALIIVPYYVRVRI
jgi:hypothetical protein